MKIVQSIDNRTQRAWENMHFHFHLLKCWRQTGKLEKRAETIIHLRIPLATIENGIQSWLIYLDIRV